MPEVSLPPSNDTVYIPRLQQLLRDIEYRYAAPLARSVDFLQAFHHWMHNTLGPVTSWTTARLDILEVTSSAIMERAYPYANVEMKLLIGKLTALAIVIDDSLDDDAMYNDIGSFGHYVYIGESQSSGLLQLYHGCIKELSHMHEGDAVLRGIAVGPWISFVDGCLLEKRLLTVDAKLRASPFDMGYEHVVQQHLDDAHGPRDTLPGAMCHFPAYLRDKTGIGDAYAAAIFKATKDQDLPLSRYITALPDISFWIVAINDLLSFHKEELDGETANMIHLKTRSLRERKGTGASGEWTVTDTFSLLCDETKAATIRIDEILRLRDCEEIAREGSDCKILGLSEADMAIARQWRGWRDGYISWHLECQRYKLDFMRPTQFHTS